MAEFPDDIPYYYNDLKQKNLEKLIAKFQETSDATLFDNINIFTFSQNGHAIEKEIVPRMCQAVVRLNTQSQLDLQKYQILYQRFVVNIDKEDMEVILERLSHLIEPFVKPQFCTVANDWLRQRNVCFVMAMMIGKYGKFVDLKYFTSYLEYFLKIAENIVSDVSKGIENLLKEAVLYATISLDNLAMLNRDNEQMNKGRKMLFEFDKEIAKVFPMFVEMINDQFPIIPKMYQMNKSQINKIQKKFVKLSSLANKNTFYSSKFDSFSYQIGFLAKWCCDNVLTSKNGFFIPSVIAKMSKFSVRNFTITKHYFTPVRSAFEVTSGVFYYEVVLLTSGSIRIGWATSTSVFSEEPKLGVGEDKFSIGFDGNGGFIWHDGKHVLKKAFFWKSLDVIGCLINVSQQKFVFYQNGRKIAFNDKDVYFSSLPYFAVVALSPHQQCCFNFGQEPFKFPPKEIQPNSFHSASNGVEQKYQLLGFHLNYSNERFLSNRYYNNEEYSSSNIKFDNIEHQKDVNQFIESVFARTVNSHHILDFVGKFPEIISRHGVIMLNQALHNKSIRKKNNLLEHIHLFIDIFCKNGSEEKVTEFLYLFWKSTNTTTKFTHSKLNNEQIRNFCLLALFSAQLQDLDHYIFRTFKLDYTIEVLLSHIEKSKNLELLLLEILTFQMFILAKIRHKECFSENLVTRIVQVLEKHATFLDEINVCQLIRSTKSDDFFKYQIGFCARWQLDHLSPIDYKSFTSYKVLNNQLDVRNDLPFTFFIRSSPVAFKPEQTCYYYEITLITEGFLYFGWATRETETYSAIGQDKFSIGINEFTDIFHQKLQAAAIYSSERPCWRRGDVIGCWIDIESKKFGFLINGFKIDLIPENEINFSNQPYFACAILDSNQQCHFNFGQEPFAYLRKGYEYSFALKDKHEKFVTLLEPNYLKEEFWFKLDIENVNFRDKEQLLFDQFLVDLENRVLDFNYCYGDCEELFRHFIKLMQIDTQTHLRLIQTMIENLGKICLKNGNENLIQHELLAIEEHLKPIEIKPNELHLLEMFYPYLQLNSDNQYVNQNQIRNIFISLSMYWKEDEPKDELNKILYDVAKPFLLNAISKTEDNLTLLYAIICLEQFSMNASNKKNIILQDLKRVSELSDFVNLVTCDNLYEFYADYIKYQVGLCSNWFCEKILSIENQTFDTKKLNSVTLDPRSATEHLKLSPDLLSARSDFGKQSVYCNFAISSDVYYYEIILLTSGSIWIGWDTKNDDQINFEKKNELVAIDGHMKIISIHGIHEPLEIESNSWKFGDVIGCLIDCKQHKFVFYLNGKQIYSKDNIENFSSDAYFASAILSSRQQCYFNFGQTKFKYSPNLLFKDFNNKSYNDNICLLCLTNTSKALTQCCQVKVCINCLLEPTCSYCQTV